LNRIKRQDTELFVTNPDSGPHVIETDYDELLSAAPTLRLVKQANREGYDAVILACFSDPALVAAREISDILILGIEEVSLHIAAMLGARFTVLTTRKQRIAHKVEEVHRYRMDSMLASVRALELTVVETDVEPARTKQRILQVSREAAEQDGAEVIILGCAGMVGYAEEAARDLGLVVIDPSSVALKICEGMVEAGLKHSKRSFYSPPPDKDYRGLDLG
jgi:allantoin racemase